MFWAFSDTQLILAILFSVLEKFVLCFSTTPALWSRIRGQNSVSDHLSQKHQSLLKMEPLHHFSRIDSGKFPSTGSVREEVLIHFTPSWSPPLGSFHSPCAHTTQQSCLPRSQSPACDALSCASNGKCILMPLLVGCTWALMNHPRQVCLLTHQLLFAALNGTALVYKWLQ